MDQTQSERFASRIIAALGDQARVKYTGSQDDGTLVVVSETQTGINFAILVEAHIEEPDEEPDEERELPCGCPPDYHLADCPIRTG